MEELTNMHIEAAKHCIGLDYKKPYTRHSKKFYRPYRNYYFTLPNNAIWDALEKYGYARKSVVKNDWMNPKRCFFKLTRRGLDWLGNELNTKIYDESF